MNKYTIRNVRRDEKPLEHRLRHMIACLEVNNGRLIDKESTFDRVVFESGAVFEGKLIEKHRDADLVFKRISK